MIDTLKFFDRQVRLLWMYNALFVNPLNIKRIIVYFDERDETYYPCNSLDDDDVRKKINEMGARSSNVKILEVIDLEKETFNIAELESFYL